MGIFYCTWNAVTRCHDLNVAHSLPITMVNTILMTSLVAIWLVPCRSLLVTSAQWKTVCRGMRSRGTWPSTEQLGLVWNDRVPVQWSHYKLFTCMVFPSGMGIFYCKWNAVTRCHDLNVAHSLPITMVNTILMTSVVAIWLVPCRSLLVTSAQWKTVCRGMRSRGTWSSTEQLGLVWNDRVPVQWSHYCSPAWYFPVE